MRAFFFLSFHTVITFLLVIPYSFFFKIMLKPVLCKIYG